MPRYARVWVALFAGSALAAFMGWPVVAMVLFPVPVAGYWALGSDRQALGLVLCAALSGATFVLAQATGHDPSAEVQASTIAIWATAARVALHYGCTASLGLVLGAGLRRRWSYGWTVAAATSAAYALILASAFWAWDTTQRVATVALQDAAAQMAEQAESATQTSYLDTIAWLADHWADVGLGLMFWPVLPGVCVMLSLAVIAVKRVDPARGPHGTFRGMRTSEWLVWVVIGTAMLWFVDHQWPHWLLRRVTWNTALVLAAIYMVNGVSVMTYAFKVLQPPLWIGLAVALMIGVLGMNPLLFVGLFDTWSDFRRIVDRLAALRGGPRRGLGARDDAGQGADDTTSHGGDPGQ